MIIWVGCHLFHNVDIFTASPMMILVQHQALDLVQVPVAAVMEVAASREAVTPILVQSLVVSQNLGLTYQRKRKSKLSHQRLMELR